MIPQPQITLRIHAELQTRGAALMIFVMAGKRCLQQRMFIERAEADRWLAEHWGLSL